MPDSVKDRIATDLKQAKEAGQLRTERIREIVKNAVSQVATELRTGSGEVRTVVKDVIVAAIAGLKEAGSEVKEGVTASIEGAIEGVSHSRRQTITQTQAEVQQLQTRLETEEQELEQQVEASLAGVEAAGQEETSPDLKDHIQRVLEALKDTEEVSLLKKRYAQLQAQLAILRANLAARYGEQYDDVQQHLDQAKTWVSQTKTRAETTLEQAEQKRSQLEDRLGEAGAAIARREKRVRQLLSELLHLAGETLQDKTATQTTEVPPRRVEISGVEDQGSEVRSQEPEVRS